MSGTADSSANPLFRRLGVTGGGITHFIAQKTAKGPNLTLAETWPQGPRTSQADQTESRLYYLGQ